MTYASQLYLNGEELKHAVFPEGITSIGSYLFNGCTSLESVTIPGTLRFVSYGAFQDCTSLSAVHIRDVADWSPIEFESLTAHPLYYAKNLY